MIGRWTRMLPPWWYSASLAVILLLASALTEPDWDPVSLAFLGLVGAASLCRFRYDRTHRHLATLTTEVLRQVRALAPSSTGYLNPDAGVVLVRRDVPGNRPAEVLARFSEADLEELSLAKLRGELHAMTHEEFLLSGHRAARIVTGSVYDTAGEPVDPPVAFTWRSRLRLYDALRRGWFDATETELRELSAQLAGARPIQVDSGDQP